MIDKLEIEDITLPIIMERSSRKTLSISITDDISLRVKAPIRMTDREIERFINGKKFWIYKQAVRVKKDNAGRVFYSDEEIRRLREKARGVLTEKTDYYKKLLNVDYQRIRIGDQKTRWGSCSSKGTISYSWRLVLMPEDIQDYVVVHELSHLLEMNHSSRFWEHVGSVIPDYKNRRSWLRQHGNEYM
ncbi:MAG: M48 family metallopeptidase [Lachnospiraceae bacterium]|nr:M48 family metallopeptidase [Lachnospiraceae bacterium]